MSNELDPQNLDKNYGQEIDAMVKLKHEAKLNLIKASGRLLEMGAKILVDGVVNSMPGLDVEKYQAQNFQEFAWVAEFEKTMMHQFSPDGDNHFGNIDQSKLLKFSWVSCFEVDTSNLDRRVIVELDFKTGKFTFLNGQVPQAIRADADEGYPPIQLSSVQPKLIMKMVKRNSETVDRKSGKVSEIAKYNRYLIGWEVGAAKRLFCIEPNGLVHYWHGN